MKKLSIYLFTVIGSFLLFTSVVSAKANSIANGNPDYAKILSICAIIFGTFAMVGGMYIMLFESKNKSKKKGSKKK